MYIHIHVVCIYVYTQHIIHTQYTQTQYIKVYFFSGKEVTVSNFAINLIFETRNNCKIPTIYGNCQWSGHLLYGVHNAIQNCTIFCMQNVSVLRLYYKISPLKLYVVIKLSRYNQISASNKKKIPSL